MKRIALTILALITSVGLAFGTAYAFSEADLQKLKTTKSCAECDLSGALLIHWVLPGADLSRANLAGANLSEAFLVGANLEGANLSNAILSGASLAHANLFRAKLPEANLYVVSFAGATWTDGSQCGRGSIGSCKK